jgi:hypothetical protein
VSQKIRVLRTSFHNSIHNDYFSGLSQRHYHVSTLMQNFGHHSVKDQCEVTVWLVNPGHWLLSIKNRTVCSMILQMPELWWELANTTGMVVQLNLNCSYSSWKWRTVNICTVNLFNDQSSYQQPHWNLIMYLQINLCYYGSSKWVPKTVQEISWEVCDMITQNIISGKSVMIKMYGRQLRNT